MVPKFHVKKLRLKTAPFRGPLSKEALDFLEKWESGASARPGMARCAGNGPYDRYHPCPHPGPTKETRGPVALGSPHGPGRHERDQKCDGVGLDGRNDAWEAGKLFRIISDI